MFTWSQREDSLWVWILSSDVIHAMKWQVLLWALMFFLYRWWTWLISIVLLSTLLLRQAFLSTLGLLYPPKTQQNYSQKHRYPIKNPVCFGVLDFLYLFWKLIKRYITFAALEGFFLGASETLCCASGGTALPNKDNCNAQQLARRSKTKEPPRPVSPRDYSLVDHEMVWRRWKWSGSACFCSVVGKTLGPTKGVSEIQRVHVLPLVLDSWEFICYLLDNRLVICWFKAFPVKFMDKGSGHMIHSFVQRNSKLCPESSQTDSRPAQHFKAQTKKF